GLRVRTALLLCPQTPSCNSMQLTIQPNDLHVCATTQAWVQLGNRSPGIDGPEYEELQPVTVERRTLPETLGRGAVWQWKFASQLLLERPALFVAVIPSGFVWGDEGAVITPDGTLLADL